LTGWTVKKDKLSPNYKIGAIKYHSMRENLIFIKTTRVNNNGLIPNYSVKMFLYTDIMRKYSTQQVSNIKDKKFYEWLVGFTDGDGSFSIPKCGKYYKLQFSLSQSYYNIRILYYIKSKLGYGNVSKYEKDKMANFRISDRKVLAKIIFPIFDEFPLLTSKYFYYLRFKKAYYILENNNLTTEQKNNLISSLLKEQLPIDYISPALKNLDLNLSTYQQIDITVSNNWLIGFIEAEGYFGIIPDRIYFHMEFALTQKLDKFLLELIKRKLHIPGKIINYPNSNVLKTKNKRVIINIKDKFLDQFKGMKSLEFKLWSKALYYRETNLNKVHRIYSIFIKLKTKFK
jgi:hypothetical protein